MNDTDGTSGHVGGDGDQGLPGKGVRLERGDGVALAEGRGLGPSLTGVLRGSFHATDFGR